MMQYDGDLKLPQRFLVNPPKIDRPLGELMAGPIHAFTMQTLTASQAQDKGLLGPASDQPMLVNIEEP